MSKIEGTYLIVHANCFAAALDKKMTIVEQRFFAIYMSRLNPFDESTREVLFTLAEYERIMGIRRYHITQMKQCARKILSSSVIIDLPSGGFDGFRIFSRFKLEKVDDEWTILINCSDEILPYLFNLKKQFIKYELWNILNLSETNHQQMYRVLKQYEKIGEFVTSLDKLKVCLALDGKHTQFKDFRRDVLEKCKQALAQKTDICFDYEPIRKGRKVHSIKFMIHKNTPPADKPLLSDFVAEMAQESMIAQDQHADQDSLSEGFQLSASGQARTYSDPDVVFFAESCNNEFSEAEMNRLIDALRRRVTKKGNAYDTIDFERFHVLQTAYLEMCSRPKVFSRVNYLLKILELKEPAAT